MGLLPTISGLKAVTSVADEDVGAIIIHSVLFLSQFGIGFHLLHQT